MFMNIVGKSLAAILLATPLMTQAAEPQPSPAKTMGEEMMHGKQHGGERMGKRCEKYGMGMHPPVPMVMIPPLPPGNEKQQLQMQAEIQQKVGEIIKKYADQLK
jgi:hypothetical protein